MKKSIEVHAECDEKGRYMLVITKKRGRLNLEEITEATREYGEDYYLLLIDAYHDDDIQYDGGMQNDGDMVTLYEYSKLKGEAD
jgi:hypothetical protein